MDFPIEIPLQRPVTLGDKTYEKLVFDEPDLATSIAVEEETSPSRQTAALMAGMAGVDKPVILKVKECDLREIFARVLEPYQEQVTARNGTEVGNADPAT